MGIFNKDLFMKSLDDTQADDQTNKVSHLSRSRFQQASGCGKSKRPTLNYVKRLQNTAEGKNLLNF